MGGGNSIIGGDNLLQYLKKISSNLAPFVKISKSGDRGVSGDTFLILVERVYILYCFIYFDERRDLIIALHFA
jgi:hypothetical protein